MYLELKKQSFARLLYAAFLGAFVTSIVIGGLGYYVFYHTDYMDKHLDAYLRRTEIYATKYDYAMGLKNISFFIKLARDNQFEMRSIRNEFVTNLAAIKEMSTDEIKRYIETQEAKKDTGYSVEADRQIVFSELDERDKKTRDCSIAVLKYSESGSKSDLDYLKKNCQY